MNTDQAAALRAPFPKEQIGKLPRVTCKDCSRRQCSKHERQNCRECGNFISTQHIHLDYVGHAAVTDRLLSVDPDWTWTPDLTPDNRWDIRQCGQELVLTGTMTVCGVTRPATGSAAADSFEVVKQLISDLIRNGAMRFGVGLDLWAKEDLGHDDDAPASTPERPSAGRSGPPPCDECGKPLTGAVKRVNGKRLHEECATPVGEQDWNEEPF